MPFDTVAFTRIVERISTAGYRLFDESKTRQTKEKNTLSMYWFSCPGTPFHIYSTCLYSTAVASNHSKLKIQQFRQDRETDMADLAALLMREIPALDHDAMSLNFSLEARCAAGNPRAKVKIMDHEITSGAVRIPRLAGKIERLCQTLACVAKPDHSRFIVADKIYPANDAYDAVRIHTALACPDMIAHPPQTTPRITVSQIIDEAPLYLALFADTNAQRTSTA